MELATAARTDGVAWGTRKLLARGWLSARGLRSASANRMRNISKAVGCAHVQGPAYMPILNGGVMVHGGFTIWRRRCDLGPG